jgi:hypothetical protein
MHPERDAPFLAGRMQVALYAPAGTYLIAAQDSAVALCILSTLACIVTFATAS